MSEALPQVVLVSAAPLVVDGTIILDFGSWFSSLSPERQLQWRLEKARDLDPDTPEGYFFAERFGDWA